MDDLLTGQLAGLDESALLGIIDSSSSQSEYLARFKGDQEATAMSGILGVIVVAAESALLRRKTGITSI